MLRTSLLVLLSGALVASGCASRRGPSSVHSVPDSAPAESAGQFGAQGGLGEPYGAGGAAVSDSELQAFQNAAGDRVYFALDSYSLDPDARSVLQRQARWLGERPAMQITVAGHADERGTREYNLALGSRRASAVREFLISQGVRPERIGTVSYGKERPLDPRSNEAGWARNRNAHTVLGGSN